MQSVLWNRSTFCRERACNHSPLEGVAGVVWVAMKCTLEGRTRISLRLVENFLWCSNPTFVGLFHHVRYSILPSYLGWNTQVLLCIRNVDMMSPESGSLKAKNWFPIKKTSRFMYVVYFDIFLIGNQCFDFNESDSVRMHDVKRALPGVSNNEKWSQNLVEFSGLTSL